MGAKEVLRLACRVAALLVLPSLAGLAIGRALGSAPWGLAVGTLAGVLLATYSVTSMISSRYVQLAPPGSEEEQR